MYESESRKERHDRQSQEVEQSQRELRASIERTRKLLDQSEQMLKRHRRECEQDGAR
jgi:hypothetical protein